RIVAIPLFLVGVIIGIAGSGTFLYAFGRDPFLVSTKPLQIHTLSGEPTADFSLPWSVSDVRLSPHARQIAVLRYSAGPGVVTNFFVGASGCELGPVVANDLLFLDDEHALTVMVEGASAVVREITIKALTVTHEHRIDDLYAPRLAFRRATRRWSVTGMS